MTGTDAHVANLDPDAVAGLEKDHISNLDPDAVAGFTGDHISNLDPEAVDGFTRDQIDNLDPDAVAGFTSDQLGNLSDTAFGALDREQVDKLDPDALAGVTGSQIDSLDPSAIAGFSADHVRNIPIDAIDNLDADQVDQLDKDAVSGLTADQFANLDPMALSGFNRDNLGGLDEDILHDLDADDLDNLDPEEVRSLSGDDFARLVTNLDHASITTDAVAELLPDGWSLDIATGDLTAPPGSSLSFRSLEQSDLDDGTTVPELPDFSRSLSVGGNVEDDNVLRGLDTALGAADFGNLSFRQSADGILTVVGDGDENKALASFIPDANNITQPPEGFTPGISVDSRGAFVLTTDDGYQIPLLPAVRNPDDIVDLLPGTEVIIGDRGETTITRPQGEDSNPIVGIFDPLIRTSDEPPGLYRSGDGADEEILVVFADGSAQILHPTIQSPDEFEQAANATPGVESVEINTDGSIDIRFEGVDLTIRPLFDIEPGSAAGDATPTLLVEDGRFFFINSNGDRQEFVAG